METKLITKTIKELADEYDGNVEQLHRTISGYRKLTDDQKKEIGYLRDKINIHKLSTAKAEDNACISTIMMIIVFVLCASFAAYNYLFG